MGLDTKQKSPSGRPGKPLSVSVGGPRGSGKRRLNDRLVTALDVGTTKIVCLIAREDASGLKVIGVGHHRADGMRAGQVSNMDDLELALRACIDSAETTAGCRIDSVVVNVSGGNPQSTRLDLELDIDGREVRASDIRRLQTFGRDQEVGPNRDLIHCQSLSYAVDGADGILDPRGMFGQTLGVSMHIVSSESGPLRNLSTVIERCHLTCEARVLTPYASALACLSEEEKDLGATVIDMGGGVTSVAVFSASQLVYAGVLPLGAQHITGDIMQGLTTPFHVAERLKTMHGSCLSSPSDSRDLLRIPQIGEDAEGSAHEIPRSVLNQIIRPRVEETFEMLRDHLNSAGVGTVGTRLAVLTGGGAQLQGVRDLAESVLERPVVQRQPVRIRGQAENAIGPSFATANGLLRYASLTRTTPSLETRSFDPQSVPGSVLGRVTHWLRENF